MLANECQRKPLSSSLLLSSLELSDTQVYEPYIRARLGTAAHFCVVVVHCQRNPVPSSEKGRSNHEERVNAEHLSRLSATQKNVAMPKNDGLVPQTSNFHSVRGQQMRKPL